VPVEPRLPLKFSPLLQRWAPGLHNLLSYQRSWLRQDLHAGLVLTAVLVPVGMAYAVAAGVPAISGLYATILGLAAYALFGPSRVLVLGPDSALVALTAVVVVPLSAGDPQRAVALAAAMALVSGLLCVAAGMARLGFVTELLSKPIRYGYMNGIAITVIVSQLPALFGFRAAGNGLLADARGFAHGLLAGHIQTVALSLGLGTLVLMALMRRWPRWPGALLAVVASTAATHILDLSAAQGVPVLGSLPQGLPAPAWPALLASDLRPVLLGGLAIALVSFADTSVLSRTLAARAGHRVDSNQEMLALGAANVAAGLFQGLPISASASRTPVAEAAGARSQATGLVGAFAVLALLMLAPHALESLPRAVMAAVVIASAISLLEVNDLKRIYRIQRWEFWLSMGCLAGVVVWGPLVGIGLAVCASVIEFLWDGWRPHSAVLGRVDDVKGFHDIRRYPQARLVPGLVLFRWDAPLFFANAEWFHDRVLDAVAAAPSPTRWLVVGAEPVTSVDVTATDMLDDLVVQLEATGIRLCFAEMKDPVKDKLKRFGTMRRLGEDRFFPTLGEAVGDYCRLYKVGWAEGEPNPAFSP
jgi:high affinity sulfate transporter 1